MSATFHAKAYEETKCHGLQEGVKHQLNCNDCDNPLLVIWEVNPYFTFRDGTPYSYNYKAKCPFCGGMSETKKINGEVRFLEIVEEQELEGQTQFLRSRRPEFGTALDITFNFLKNPYLYWIKDDLTSKHLVLKLVFSERLIYSRENGFGTAHLALPLRVFELTEHGGSVNVEMGGIEPPSKMSLEAHLHT